MRQGGLPIKSLMDVMAGFTLDLYLVPVRACAADSAIDSIDRYAVQELKESLRGFRFPFIGTLSGNASRDFHEGSHRQVRCADAERVRPRSRGDLFGHRGAFMIDHIDRYAVQEWKESLRGFRFHSLGH